MRQDTSKIEKARLDIERQRLEFEKSKAEPSRSFFKSNSGVLISAAVSLAAVIVSLSQVWVTKITKDKELEIMLIQKKSELDLQERQKERELILLDAQKKREWDLSAAKFITDNRKAIFSGTPDEQKLFARIITTIYPADISSYILERIEKASPPAAKQTWREARKKIEQGPMPESAEVNRSQPQQEPVEDIPPADMVSLTNRSNQPITFFLREGNSAWRQYQLKPSEEVISANTDQISILTANQKPAIYALERGGKYRIFWNDTRWDIAKIISR